MRQVRDQQGVGAGLQAIAREQHQERPELSATTPSDLDSHRRTVVNGLLGRGLRPAAESVDHGARNSEGTLDELGVAK